jgi:hypothetical protein
MQESSKNKIFNCFTKYKGKFLFVWINKTGGASIAKALGIKYDKKGRWYNHYTAIELRDIVGINNFKNIFKFCFVRNPWDKVFSEFSFRVFTCQNDLNESSIFSDWVRQTYYQQDPKYYDWPKMFIPQLDWITDEKGNIMVNFIGRYEKLRNDFNIICDRLNIKRITLPHENASRSDTSYRKFYDEETKKIVEKKFQKDIEYFSYKF